MFPRRSVAGGMRGCIAVSSATLALALSACTGTAPTSPTPRLSSSPSVSAAPPPKVIDALIADAPRGGGVLLVGRDAADYQIVAFVWDGLAWRGQRPPTQPSLIWPVSLITDPHESTPLLLGRVSVEDATIGVWRWKDGDWQELPSSSPGPTGDVSAAYDASGRELVAFGGCCVPGTMNPGMPLSNTWKWKPSGWQPVYVPFSPPARQKASMAFDAARGQVVMFGGFVNGSGSESNDTWTFDGKKWTLLHPAESPPADGPFAQMAYDAGRQEIVLFQVVVTAPKQLQAQTWTWKGTTWVRQNPPHSPPAGNQRSLAYDSKHQQVIQFQLQNGGYPAQTWAWNGSDWTRLN